MRLLISPSAKSCSPIVVSVAPSGIVTVTRRCSAAAGSSARRSGRYHSTKSWTMPCSIAPGFSSTHDMTLGAKIQLKPRTMRTPRSAIVPRIHISRRSGWTRRFRRIGPSRRSRSSRMRASRRSSYCRLIRSPRASRGRNGARRVAAGHRGIVAGSRARRLSRARRSPDRPAGPPSTGPRQPATS